MSNRINISSSSINNINNSSFQYISNSGRKPNISYLNFIKEFRIKNNEPLNSKDKLKKGLAPYLIKFVNKNNKPVFQTITEVGIFIKSSYQQNKIKENNIKKEKEIIKIKKELQNKDKKIKELTDTIENKNNEYNQLNKKYIDAIAENEKLKVEIQKLKNEINRKENNIQNNNINANINNNSNESPKYNN
jgi:hypothetical protein